MFIKEDRVKSKFVEFNQVKAYEKLLDFGCGTGTLSLMFWKSNNKFIINDTFAQMKNHNGTKLLYEDIYFNKILSS